MFGKLYIYDASSPEDRDQARVRFDDDEVWVLGVTSKGHLLAELSRLVVEKAYFSRVLVQTHGGPGFIKFGGGGIYDTTLTSDFARGGYHRLFPLYTKMYFDGCNVAEGYSGDVFLNAVGSVFLRSGGGEALGWTSPGYGITNQFPFYLPFIGGHTIHFTGNLKRFHFRPGGVRFTPPPGPFGLMVGPPPA